jgi:hypothetical protein
MIYSLHCARTFNALVIAELNLTWQFLEVVVSEA